MKILVVNCGSSSLKYQLIDMDNDSVLASGKCDRIGGMGINMPFIEYKKGNGQKVKAELELPDHTKAFETVIEYLTDPEIGAIKDLSEINGIGHRIVNGGPKFTKATLVTDEVMEEYKKAIEYAPLHNPAHIQGIEACTKIMPNIPQVLVFDTSFHTTIPEEASLYAIPYEYSEKYAIKRYGAHGTSHKFITKEAAKVLGKNKEDINIISCHLGNGSSIAAVKNGKCVETSMGLTPLEGLVMGTRSGDLDPAILEFIMKKENLNTEQMDKILNKQSGKLGISGVSFDDRDIEVAAEEGNARAKLAIDVFVYQVVGYIGRFAAQMNGVDVITFAGGIGENAIDVRKQICESLSFLGVKVDEDRNNCRGKEVEISTFNSKVKVFVVPTNEELMIARDTMEVVSK